jgi:tetratricopeptide (TPR) repeat protein
MASRDMFARIRAVRAYNRGNLLYRQYQQTGELGLLQAAIALLGNAIDATPIGHHDRPGYLSDLGMAFQDRFEQSGQRDDLEKAITLLTEAVGSVPVGHPDRHRYLLNLGNALRVQFERIGQLAVLDGAITVGQQAVDAVPARHPNRHMYPYNLGLALEDRFLFAGQFADLERAIRLLLAAVKAAPASHPDQPVMLSSLGNALRNRFERTGRLEDLDQAVAIGRQAVDAAPAHHPGRPGHLSNLANVLLDRFSRTGQLEDLDLAVAIGQQAVDATPAGHIHRSAVLSNLAASLTARFQRTGQPTDLDRAITAGQQAVDATLASDPDRHMYLSNLGTAFRHRFGRTGDLADLDRAITAGQQAVDATPADHTSRSGYLSNLANALANRFGRTGQDADLDRAITVGQQAVDAAPVSHTARPMYLSNLGTALQQRFERTGQLGDLDQAIARLSAAVEASPPDHPDRATYLSNHAIALHKRFRRTGRQADLDQAVTSGQQAIYATPADHPLEPLYSSNLGVTLLTRYERTGDPSDADHAIARLSAAVDTTAGDHPDLPRYLCNLGFAWQKQFEHTGQLGDLDQAIARLSAAVKASPADHPDRTLYLARLGLALQARFQRSAQQADLNQAIIMFREGAAVRTASAERRLAAASGWGWCALRAGDPGEAVVGYATAIDQLQLVAWHGLGQATREHHLRTWAGLAPDAAAAAVAAGQADLAVELLEEGRSILWTQAARLRQDLDALREQAPSLASALESARAVIDVSPTSVIDGPGMVSDDGLLQAAGQRTPEQDHRCAEQRRQAALDWDDAIKQVRKIKGLEDFLRPARYADLRAAAAKGTVVMVNVSRHGSHAFLVSAATGPERISPVVVGLPDAPRDIVTKQANVLLGAQRRAGSLATGWQRESDRHAVFDVLAWSWQAITEPILAALGHTDTPEGRIEDWPRLWWCPTGPATSLPLHAAGHHPRTRHQRDAMGERAALADTVAGRVISSYASTLTVLAQNRARSAPEQIRQLAVGVPEAPSYAPDAGALDQVAAELQAVGKYPYLGAPKYATHLLGPAATKQAVLELLPGHSWLHMSCHGLQHPGVPSLSAFLLYDQPLTLADLAALSPHETDLAYLAACETASGDLRLPDEALHLAGALQLGGYRHVLATLWSIADTLAPDMAGIIYASLLHPDPGHSHPSDRPVADRAPYALHRAVALRQQASVGDPLLWSPYVHLGP